MNGIYSLVFRGLADWGMGVLVLRNGIVCGTDTNGVLIDGTYREEGSLLALELLLTVPPGVALVQGTPAQSSSYKFPIQASIPIARMGTSDATLVQTPQGPLNVLVRKLRELQL